MKTGEKKVSLDSFFWKGFIAGFLLSLSLQAFVFSKHSGQLPAYWEKGHWEVGVASATRFNPVGVGFSNCLTQSKTQIYRKIKGCLSETSLFKQQLYES